MAIWWFVTWMAPFRGGSMMPRPDAYWRANRRRAAPRLITSGAAMISPTMILSRLDARDRTLLLRCTLADSSRRARLAWTTLTHVGGAMCTIVAAALPLLVSGPVAAIATRALNSLIVSHIVVQLVKRTVGRPRPSRSALRSALVVEPDRFSFPSGHAAAAMSVAYVYAFAFPSLAVPLLSLAGAVGLSRVFLGVHYPGDVLMGQLIAVGTSMAVVHGWR
jgi:undecaprenyl-diphosphatase